MRVFYHYIRFEKKYFYIKINTVVLCKIYLTETVRQNIRYKRNFLLAVSLICYSYYPEPKTTEKLTDSLLCYRCTLVQSNEALVTGPPPTNNNMHSLQSVS